MKMPTKIEWATESWNPITGCSKTSQGCRNCYAERMARRLAGRHGYPEAPRHFDVTFHPGRLEEPLRWRKPRRVFVCSMGDLFHENVTIPQQTKIFEVMCEANWHTYLVLTKRPERMASFIHWWCGECERDRSHIHLGVTAENQKTADERIPLLLQTPAAVHFVSLEPLLSPINLSQYLGLHDRDERPWIPYVGDYRYRPLWRMDAWEGGSRSVRPLLHWVVVAGESGPGARPMHPDWARDIRDQCQAVSKWGGEYHTAFFFKSWGAWSPHADDIFEVNRKYNRTKKIALFEDPYRKRFMARVGKKRAGRLLDGKVWGELPEGE